MLRLFSLCAYLAPLTSTANTCYWPLGGVSGAVPCDPNAEVSLCCGSQSACLTNGICQHDDTNTTGITYSRGSCTDKTWTSSICPQHCQISKSGRRLVSVPHSKTDFLALDQDSDSDPEAYNFGTGGVQIYECGSQGYGSPADYCCASAGEKARCCSTSSAVFELVAAATGNPSSITSSPLVSSSSSTTKPTSSTPAVPSSVATTSTILSSTLHQDSSTSQAATVSQNRSGTGLKVGVGVGVPLGIVIMAGLAYLIWHKRHHEARLERLEKQLVIPQQHISEENSPFHTGEPLEMPVYERAAMLGVPKDHLHELPTVEPVKEMETVEGRISTRSKHNKASV